MKNKRILSWIVAIVLVLSLAPTVSMAEESLGDSIEGTSVTLESLDTPAEVEGPAEVVFAGGEGTQDEPYQIETEEQLDSVREHLDNYFVLQNNLDLSDYEGWKPIGILTYSQDVDMKTGDMDLTKAFSGSFDGQDHTISGINVTTDQDMLGVGGLFACSTGKISNLKVEKVTVTGDKTSMAVGGVVGYAIKGEISKVEVKDATVTGINCVGGIVGGSSANLSYCVAEDANIVVIGNNDFANGRIVQCDVAECGGLVVGGAFNGSVNNCTATGTVTAEGTEPVGLGGIGGCLQSMESITGNTANVIIKTTKGGHAIGGLCGYAGIGNEGTGADQGTVNEPTKIFDCHVTVNIDAPGATHVGGLVGTGLYFYGMEDRFNVENCTVEGTILAGTEEPSIYGMTVPGGVAGRATGCDVSGCNFDSLTINGQQANTEVGTTNTMYESGDQYDEEQDSGALLYGLTGTYQPLFEEATFKDEYSHYWYDYCAAILGKENADIAVATLKKSIGGSIFGQEAVAAYNEHPENTQFACGFINGVSKITFNGTQISGIDKDGQNLFSHPYRYVGYKASTDQEGFNFYIFESTSGNEDEYKYFALCPDTPATTHHIEFRYGRDMNELLQLYAGDYAYWMGSGIATSALTDPKEVTLEQVIGLFCLENMNYTEARTPSSLAGVTDLVGTWDADLSGYPELAGKSLYCVLKADGTGTTYLDGAVTDTYRFYAYDNDGKADTKTGIYVAYNEEPESSKYTITTENGKTVLAFYSAEGNHLISYTLRTSSSSGGKGHSGSKNNSRNTASAPTTSTPAETTPKTSEGVTDNSQKNFSDVAKNAYYANAVQWALEKGITAGTSGTTFAPGGSCSRAQTVTFLWRAAGSPQPVSKTNPFTDVNPEDYYYDAVLWALEKGITEGTSATTFGSDATVTRSQTAVFLWRATGSPAADKANSFKDVAEADYYYNAVQWAAQNGITTGVSDTTFSAGDPCTRGQIVTFLYRNAQ
ncbi:S-layer homology domain-containing protein [Aminipila butyrica]|uniref:S-layer homology domain-containing protein n=1 Tax=Aminipila butyrica TaxID=433296 RepID=A0A858BQ55_9FIRM|nr:S-layer homology domain-containing protein [Aminipila butyrica]QIB67991.1 S-layer homology domain-containing protein [Aminipila butyrica]